jgi:hypothetical protein
MRIYKYLDKTEFISYKTKYNDSTYIYVDK